MNNYQVIILFYQFKVKLAHYGQNDSGRFFNIFLNKLIINSEIFY